MKYCPNCGVAVEEDQRYCGECGAKLEFDPMPAEPVYTENERLKNDPVLNAAAQSPAPKSTETAFTDVAPKAFYAKAVAWAVEEGVTKGMTDTTFAPNDTCTRGQVVTFLYRAMGGK